MNGLSTEAVRLLLNWFRREKRDLPWRGAKDAYRVLVSEIMLQQTHVEWRMTGKLIRAEEFYSAYVWATAQEIAKKYALPSAFKAFMGWIH